jgi:hypothetical protein
LCPWCDPADPAAVNDLKVRGLQLNVTGLQVLFFQAMTFCWPAVLEHIPAIVKEVQTACSHNNRCLEQNQVNSMHTSAVHISCSNTGCDLEKLMAIQI